MRNQQFYHQMPPVRPQHHFHRPGRMPHQGFRPPHRGYNPGMVPPGLASPKGSMPKLDGFLETCNRLLATAQGFQPYIAQATPLIRNLPALWRMYKGFKSAPNAKEHKDEHEEEDYYEDYESTSFEYVYKEDIDNESSQEKNHRHDKDNGGKHFYEEPIRHKHDYEDRKERPNRRHESHHFFPIHREKRHEPKVEKLARPVKTKPSVPRIFQPPFHFDE
nr:VrrA/YqfQ family protein [Lysinibacillus timonensis]